MPDQRLQRCRASYQDTSVRLVEQGEAYDVDDQRGGEHFRVRFVGPDAKARAEAFAALAHDLCWCEALMKHPDAIPPGVTQCPAHPGRTIRRGPSGED